MMLTWSNPAWPEPLSKATTLRLDYGIFADELVVRFDDIVHWDALVVPIATPDIEYAGLLVARDSGAVVGVHVYPLVAYATRVHLDWKAAAEPDSSPAVAARIVADIKELFDRHGIELSEPVRA